MKAKREDEVFWQIADAGYAERLLHFSVTGDHMAGIVDSTLIASLEHDERFANGLFYGLHTDVGSNLVDFRSYNGVIGPGSLQIVIDRKTGAFYADVDRFNPYEDVVRFLGHTGEVLAGLFRRVLPVLLLLLFLPAPARAELAWPAAHRDTANTISNWLVGANLAADTIANLRAEHPKQALGCQAFRLGVSIGAAEGLKHLVKEPRPDGSDHLSFPSEHTWIASVSSGWRFSVGIPIAVGAGYFRVAANKHSVADVVAGAFGGFLSRKVCAHAL